jgi:hypothetical protein
MKALKIEANEAGKRYAIVPGAGGTFTVYAECSNYSSRAPGSIAKVWRYCDKGLTLAAAEALFARKIAGKQRY